MSFSVSIGDPILLSTVCYKLGRKLTTDRKSAPSEYKELQNQLFALGKALAHVEKSSASQPITDEGNALRQIVQNCRTVLTRLENLFNKYAVLDPVSAGGTQSESNMQKWANQQWKKVMWTTERDGIESIKNDLGSHISALNLYFASMNSSHGSITLDKVTQINRKLDEVHEWFTENLKNRRPVTSRQDSAPDLSGPEGNASDFTFQIYANLGDETLGFRNTLLCPTAAFADEWRSANISLHGKSLFVCHCSHTIGPVGRPHAKQLKLSLLPISLIIRSIEKEPAWQLYCTSSHGVISLAIKGVSPLNLAEFQDHIDFLAAAQALKPSGRQRSSMLVYQSPNQGHARGVSVLDAMCDLSRLRGHVATVSFTSGGKQFTQRSVDTVQILHYRSAQVAHLDTNDRISDQFHHHQYGEVVFTSISSGIQSLRSFIRVKKDSKISFTQDSCTVEFYDVMCTADHPEDINYEPDRIDSAKVEVRFITAEASRQFTSSLKSLQHQLQAYHFQFPALNDYILLKRDVGDCMIRQLFIKDATLTLAFAPLTNTHRIILSSNSHSASLSMELSSEFTRSIRALKDKNSIDIHIRALPAHYVQNTEQGTTITEEQVEVDGMILSASKLALID